MMSRKKLISLVIPVFNEEKNIKACYNRISEVAQSLDNYKFEFIFTDNHSEDGTFAVLEKIAKKDKRVRVFRFSRNFGFQRSIWTGYSKSEGDAAIQLDVDLQDPPELIREFIAKWEQGYKVVYGIRRSRKENFVINSARKVFYRILSSLSEDELPVDAGDFRLIDRQVIDALVRNRDKQPYLRGAIAAMGFKQIGIPYDRDARKNGHSKFKLSDLIKLSIDGILNHSTIPLRIASYVGITVATLTSLAVIGVVFARLVFGSEWPAGFASTTILILFSLSLNAMFLGIIGEYLGRIYKQVKTEHVTLIEQSIND